MSLRKIVLGLYLSSMIFLCSCAATVNFSQTKFAHSIDTTHAMTIYRWERAKQDADYQFANYKHPVWERIKSKVKTIDDVNTAINSFKYKTDFEQFETEEYWQTPYEFITNRAGDCEDYAIAKYYMLRQLGVSDNDLKIVLLRTQAGEGHAVLLVRYDNKWLLLDNRYSKVIEVTKIPEVYTPFWAVNHSKYWTYIK